MLDMAQNVRAMPLCALNTFQAAKPYIRDPIEKHLSLSHLLETGQTQTRMRLAASASLHYFDWRLPLLLLLPSIIYHLGRN